jgi:hypothetical protein
MRRPWQLLMMMLLMKERNCRRRHHDRPQRAVGQPWPAAIGEGATLSRYNLAITARAMLKCTCRRRRRRGGATQMARRRAIVGLVALFLCAGNARGLFGGVVVLDFRRAVFFLFASFRASWIWAWAWLVFQRGPGLVRRLSEAGCFGVRRFLWSPEPDALLSSAACFVSVLVAAFAHLPTNAVSGLAAVQDCPPRSCSS